MNYPRDVTPVWDELGKDVVEQVTTFGDQEAIGLASIDTSKQVIDNSESDRPACVVYDEGMAAATLDINAAFQKKTPESRPEHIDFSILADTDAFTRQGDKGPYHWIQGPQDVAKVKTTTPVPAPTPPVTPSPKPERVKPGQLPRHGQVITTSNVRLRKSPGTGGDPWGVIPTGTAITLTGGRRIKEGTLWVRVHVDAGELGGSQNLRPPDQWLSPPRYGWINSQFVAVPASEYVALDFPLLTHEFLWWLDDAGGLDADTIRRTLTAITDDPRGPLRCGLDVREAPAPDKAHVLVRFVDDACSGAAGCYYKRAGERARVDIAKKWFSTAWLSRVFLHETVGHAATRSYDHYNNAPQYPRQDYYGLMGNWQDAYGDHAWPDEDDIANFRDWLQGASMLVFVRDLGEPAG